MPNYMEIIGECYPDAHAESRGDPTVYNSIVWKTTQISQAELDAADCTNNDESIIIDLTGIDVGKVPQWDGTKWVVAEVTGGGGSVFGSEHHEVSSDTESSTTSTTNQTKATMTTSSLPNGKYRIGWFCELKSSSNKSSVEMETTMGGTVLGTGRVEPKDTNNWEAYSGHYYDTISGVQTIDLNYSREGGNATASIRRARIEIWRIS